MSSGYIIQAISAFYLQIITTIRLCYQLLFDARNMDVVSHREVTQENPHSYMLNVRWENSAVKQPCAWVSQYHGMATINTANDQYYTDKNTVYNISRITLCHVSIFAESEKIPWHYQ